MRAFLVEDADVITLNLLNYDFNALNIRESSLKKLLSNIKFEMKNVKWFYESEDLKLLDVGAYTQSLFSSMRYYEHFPRWEMEYECVCVCVCE